MVREHIVCGAIRSLLRLVIGVGEILRAVLLGDVDAILVPLRDKTIVAAVLLSPHLPIP